MLSFSDNEDDLKIFVFQQFSGNIPDLPGDLTAGYPDRLSVENRQTAADERLGFDTAQHFLELKDEDRTARGEYHLSENDRK